MGKGNSVGDWKTEPICGYCIFGSIQHSTTHTMSSLCGSCRYLNYVRCTTVAYMSCCPLLMCFSPTPQVEAQLSYAFDQWGDAFYEERVMVWKGVMHC